MEEPNRISLAIWGLMPQDFKEDWHIFQDNANTLNVKVSELEDIDWMQESFEQRRCLIIVTGFYTHLLENGNTCSFYIHQANNRPFYLAGTYNRLDDGFLCTALMVDKTDTFLTKYHNISNLCPVIIPKAMAMEWLNQKATRSELEEIIQKPKDLKLKAKRLSNEFFLNHITSDTQHLPLIANSQD